MGLLAILREPWTEISLMSSKPGFHRSRAGTPPQRHLMALESLGLRMLLMRKNSMEKLGG